jgi:hypothetical protein
MAVQRAGSSGAVTGFVTAACARLLAFGSSYCRSWHGLGCITRFRHCPEGAAAPLCAGVQLVLFTCLQCSPLGLPIQLTKQHLTAVSLCKAWCALGVKIVAVLEGECHSLNASKADEHLGCVTDTGWLAVHACRTFSSAMGLFMLAVQFYHEQHDAAAYIGQPPLSKARCNLTPCCFSAVRTFKLTGKQLTTATWSWVTQSPSHGAGSPSHPGSPSHGDHAGVVPATASVEQAPPARFGR